MKPKILIADDEPDSVSFMKDALEDAGYDVLVAYDGTQVFEQLANRPNLIILNVMMPHADGFEVARAIRDRVSCPILFLSARGAPEKMRSATSSTTASSPSTPATTSCLSTKSWCRLRRGRRRVRHDKRADGDRPPRHVAQSQHDRAAR